MRMHWAVSCEHAMKFASWTILKQEQASLRRSSARSKLGSGIFAIFGYSKRKKSMSSGCSDLNCSILLYAGETWRGAKKDTTCLITREIALPGCSMENPFN